MLFNCELGWIELVQEDVCRVLKGQQGLDEWIRGQSSAGQGTHGLKHQAFSLSS